MVLNGTIIKQVSSHNHLGLDFNDRLTWDTHIKRIITGANKIICLLKSLYKHIPRTAKSQIYKTFIRPKLEYACVIFDACPQNLSAALEHVQRQAALTVLGAYRKTSHISLLDELGWEPLAVRRKVYKLSLFYKMICGLVPEYLCTLIPQTIASILSYELRNQNNLREVHARTVRFKKSYIPSTVSSWNRLSLDTRGLPTLSAFKAKLKDDHYRVPKKLHLYGTSHGAVNHSRIHMGLSGLNQQRRKYNFIDSGRCSTCNFIREDAQHYFLKCSTYAIQRGMMYGEICHTLTTNVNPDLLIPQTAEELTEFLKLILHGSDQSDYKTNKAIFDSVHNFIYTSKRFM